MKNIIIVILSIVILILSLSLLYQNKKELFKYIEGLGNISTAVKRAKIAEKADKSVSTDIVIGIICNMNDEADKNLLNGAMLACKEINGKGGIFGRKIKLIGKNDSGNDEECKYATQELVLDPNVVALIGGNYYSSFMSVASLCEFNELLLISPVLTAGLSPNQPYLKMTFINYPKIGQILDVMNCFMEANKLEGIAILNSSEFQYGYYFSNAFDRYIKRDAMGEKGVIYRQIFYSESDIKQLLGLMFSNEIESDANSRSLKSTNKEIQAVLVVGDILFTKEVIDFFMNIRTPPIFMATDDMETEAFLKLCSTNYVRIYFPSVYDPGLNKLAVRNFEYNFKNNFKKSPDVWAAQGYDTLKLIAAAMENAHSTVPSKVAESLHKIKFTENVSASPYISFDKKGELDNGKVIIKYTDNGRFNVLKNMQL